MSKIFVITSCLFYYCYGFTDLTPTGLYDDEKFKNIYCPHAYYIDVLIGLNGYQATRTCTWY